MTSPTYDGKPLFATGPASTHIDGAALAFAEHQPLAADGGNVFAQGRQPRQITQTGSLLDDDVTRLHEQCKAIEAYVDGAGREFVDEHGRAWPNVVMLRFEPATPRRLGARWHTAYRVTYRQLRP